MLLQHQKGNHQSLRVYEVGRQGTQKYFIITSKIRTGLLNKKIRNNQLAHENDQSQITTVRSVRP